jgi:hypothetical protein
MCPQLPWALWWGVSSLGTFKSALLVSTVVVVSSSKAVVKNSKVVVKQHRGSARRCRMKRVRVCCVCAEGGFAGRGVRLRHKVRGGRCSICFA